MKCQMCWEALESLPPNISLKASAIFRALALRAMLSVEVGGGFPSEISSGLAPLLSWRAGSSLRETSSSPGCQLDRQPAHGSNWDPHSRLGDIPPLWGHSWRGQQSLPQADLPPPEQTDRQKLLLCSPVLLIIPRDRFIMSQNSPRTPIMSLQPLWPCSSFLPTSHTATDGEEQWSLEQRHVLGIRGELGGNNSSGTAVLGMAACKIQGL